MGKQRSFSPSSVIINTEDILHEIRTYRKNSQAFPTRMVAYWYREERSGQRNSTLWTSPGTQPPKRRNLSCDASPKRSCVDHFFRQPTSCRLRRCLLKRAILSIADRR